MTSLQRRADAEIEDLRESLGDLDDGGPRSDCPYCPSAVLELQTENKRLAAQLAQRDADVMALREALSRARNIFDADATLDAGVAETLVIEADDILAKPSPADGRVLVDAVRLAALRLRVSEILDIVHGSEVDGWVRACCQAEWFPGDINPHHYDCQLDQVRDALAALDAGGVS